MINALLLLLGAVLIEWPTGLFMSHTFNRKYSGSFCWLCHWAAMLVVYIAFLFTLPVGFAVCLPVNLILLFALYRPNWRQAVFYAAILTALPVTAAGIVFPLFGCSFDGSSLKGLSAFVCSGFLFVFLIIALYKTSNYEHPDTPHSRLYPLTAIVPLATTAILCGWMDALLLRTPVGNERILASCTAVLLFGIQLMLLFIEWYCSAQLAAEQKLHAQIRKNAIDHTILRTAREQQEQSAILIHDIKRNLSAIAALAEHSENTAIVQYISSITKLDRLHRIRQYSGNRLVNDIVSRYCERCQNAGIKTDIDIRNADFAFLSDNDLTAILDNLLENACEAAEKCEEEKWIRLQIAERNVRYLVIKLENSCALPPEGDGENLQTSKQDAAAHGYGTKIIRRTAQRYNGEASFTYDAENRRFEALIVLQHPPLLTN